MTTVSHQLPAAEKRTRREADGCTGPAVGNCSPTLMKGPDVSLIIRILLIRLSLELIIRLLCCWTCLVDTVYLSEFVRFSITYGPTGLEHHDENCSDTE